MYTGIYIQAWSIAPLIFYFIHIILFYPGWVFVYDQWPDSRVYKNQFDLYGHLLFWLTSFLVVCAATLPIVFVKQGKALFFPYLINLILSKRVHKDHDIEEKLKIDIVQLGKGLDSDSDDESVRMSQGTVQKIKGDNVTHEQFNPGSVRSEHSAIESKSEIGRLGNDDDLSSISNDNFSRNANFLAAQSESDARSSASAMSGVEKGSYPNSASRLVRSLKRTRDSTSPTFERFSGNIQEFKVKTLSKNSSEKSFRQKGRRYKNKGANKKNHHKSIDGPKFYPHLSSIGGDTIHEKSIEEDNEEPSSLSRDDDVREESKEEASSSYSSSAPSELFQKARVHKGDTSPDISETLHELPRIKRGNQTKSLAIIIQNKSHTLDPSSLEKHSRSEFDSDEDSDR